jgi:arylsulfatase A-like enzyme
VLRVVAVAAIAIALATLVGPAAPSSVRAGEAERPNIVMFYLDDMAAHDARLWSNPALTPNIYHQFVEHGVRFTNAFGESPLCCPGRASLLTGLHTHNNGVYRNNIHFLHPTANVATELKEAGYSTNWLGKYLNVFNKTPADDWAQYVKPWTHIDATYDFTDKVRTPSGWMRTGMHPTRYITNRAVELINEAGADEPFFTVLSPFNIHYPNRPVPQPPEVFAQCDSIPPWNPPNYNEADVSDKPAYIASRPLLAATDGWSLVKYCKEMFGVDQIRWLGP